MLNWLISRHPGAIAWSQAWAQQHGLQFDRVLPHLTAADTLPPNVRVYGTLPLALVAEICLRGGRYFHLTLSPSATQRGQELTAQQLDELGARFQEFTVKPTKELA